jgi:hypothetical protein
LVKRDCNGVCSVIIPICFGDSETGLRKALVQVWRNVNFDAELLWIYGRPIWIVRLGVRSAIMRDSQSGATQCIRMRNASADLTKTLPSGRSVASEW